MDDFSGRTAVVTGAASGIGRALADSFAAQGMNVVLSDVEQAPVEQAAAEVASTGVETLSVVCDVRDGAQVDSLAAAAIERFGNVHVLCNNAGVGAGGLLAEVSESDWEWVLGVNLWGVIHGIRAFLPAMNAHGEPGHIINTASMAGLVAGPFMGPYNASKFAVVAISETLHKEQRMLDQVIGVSVLCPGFVSTRIFESGRNRPEDLGGPPPDIPGDGGIGRQMIQAGIPPSQVADDVVDAVREDRFYVLTHPDMKGAIESRMRGIIDETGPAAVTFDA